VGISIVTDSTSEISPKCAAKQNIKVVPLKTVFGEKEYLEGIDLEPEGFYSMLSQSKELPKTSQSAPFDFEQVFCELQKAGDQIIVICLAGSLSGTYQSARIAQEKCGGDIWVMDSPLSSFFVQTS